MNMEVVPNVARYQALNAVRLFLATLVLFSHSFPLSGHAEPLEVFSGFISLGAIAVYSFFFVSGYLMANSWSSSQSVSAFCISRIFRIWPALVCSLFLSSLLAFLSSKYSFSEFLPGFRHYFLHNLLLLNGIEYQIPGSFVENPASGGPNGSLWTLPWEMRAYIFVALSGSLGLMAFFPVANLLLAIGICFLVVTSLSPGFSLYDNPGVPYMLGAFIIGMYFSCNKSRISFRFNALILILFGFGLIFSEDYHFKKWGVVLLLAALIIVISFAPLLKLGDLKKDLSYGVYVFAFPVQQYLVWLFPGISAWALFFSALLPVLLFAYISWEYVELPAINIAKQLRNKFKTLS